MSAVVQVLSNFLPIPKELPIDDFFHKSLDVWIVAIFGIFVAPVFEELAFRGFLLPALATSWDWGGEQICKEGAYRGRGDGSAAAGLCGAG